MTTAFGPAKALARPRPRKENRLEIEFELGVLVPVLARGEILSYRPQAVTLRLAEKTTFRPDYMVQAVDRTLWFVDVKGHMEDDAAVKGKVAAEMYPEFHFLWASQGKRGWEFVSLPTKEKSGRAPFLTSGE